MADAIPVNGKRKAPKLEVPVEAPAASPADVLATVPESLKEAAEAAVAAGKKIAVTPRGMLRVYE